MPPGLIFDPHRVMLGYVARKPQLGLFFNPMRENPPDMKLRLSMELRRKVEEAAKANNRTLSGEIIIRLEKSFEGAAEVSELERRVEALEGQVNTLWGGLTALSAKK